MNLFLKMSSDTSMESLFKTTPLNDFRRRIRDEYPMLTKMACETGFSTYAATKTKYRNRLDAEPDMRLQLSSIKPDINQLMKNKKTDSYLPFFFFFNIFYYYTCYVSK